VTNPFKKFPLVSFFILAFGITWFFHFLPMVAETNGWLVLPPGSKPWISIAFFGPAISAIVVAAGQGRASLLDLLRRMLRWRVNPLWYYVAIFGPAMIILAAVGLLVLFGGAAPGFVLFQQYWRMLPLIFLETMFVGNPLAQEIGWQGFAQPRLVKKFWHKKYSMAWVSLSLGFLASLWYAPTFILPGTDGYNLYGASMAPIFILTEMGWAFFVTWIFNHTNGSALLSGLLTQTALTLWPLVFLANSANPSEIIPISPYLTLAICLVVWLLAGSLWIGTRGELGYTHLDLESLPDE